MANAVSYIKTDYRKLDLYNFVDSNPSFTDQTPSSYHINFGNNVTVIKGQGFAFDPTFGYAVAGTTTSAMAYINGKLTSEISGIHISTAQAQAFIEADNPQEVNETVFKGKDNITGSKYNDVLNGYGGADKIKGGLGADTFVFKELTDSKVASSGRDTILDFNHSQHDRLDFHFLDANSKVGGNQAFTFIGDDAFSRHAGELQAKEVGSNTLVSGDVNGDGRADFSVLVMGHHDFERGDFIL